MTQELKIIIGITVISLLLVIGGVFFLGGSSQPTSSQVNSSVLNRNLNHQIASDSAKVTVI